MVSARPGIQRVVVEMASGARCPAYALTDTTGPVAVGDRLILNTTAVELGLGTGGSHVVHWNLARASWRQPGDGHIMKARYTSVQSDVGATEELHQAVLADCLSITAMPVVTAGLHSQVAAIAGAIRTNAPNANVAYIMSDGAALPIVISELVAELQAVGWINATITAANAFGGMFEAVSLHSALAIARHVASADVAIIAPGPGIVGTNTALGTSGIDIGAQLDAVGALGGIPIAALRASTSDPRARHQGISHHTRTGLTVACARRATVAVPDGPNHADLRGSLIELGIDARHAVVAVEIPDVFAAFDRAGLTITSMGRPARDDRLQFECGAAAGTLAVQLLPLNTGH